MRVYISGAITNNPKCSEQFKSAEEWLKSKGNEVINPLTVNSSLPFSHTEYMQVCFKLIDLSECVYFLAGWQKSKGAKYELSYAKALGKKIKFEDKQWSLKKTVSSIIDNADEDTAI